MDAFVHWKGVDQNPRISVKDATVAALQAQLDGDAMPPELRLDADARFSSDQEEIDSSLLALRGTTSFGPPRGGWPVWKK